MRLTQQGMDARSAGSEADKTYSDTPSRAVAGSDAARSGAVAPEWLPAYQTQPDGSVIEGKYRLLTDRERALLVGRVPDA